MWTDIASLARLESGQTVKLQAWLQRVRSSGRIAFLQLRDGSGFLQAVIDGGAHPEALELAKRLAPEDALELTGVLRKDPRAPGGLELDTQLLARLSRSEAYPITPKEHGVDFLMDHRHLWLRHRRPWATLRVRAALERAISEFLDGRGFLRFDAPIFTPNAAEGTTELFEVDLFGEAKVYLSQSGQLYAEAGALAFSKVYTLGPAFRAEKSKTRRHLLEFWMLEPEMAFCDQQGNMALQEELIRFLVAYVLERCQDELEILERDQAPLRRAAEQPFSRVSYEEALQLLAKLGRELPWGEDFGAPDETLLGQHFGHPVFVHSYPASIKAFYMQPNPQRPELAECADLIAPEGYGEIIGGSQRIHDLELLRTRLASHQLPEAAFRWYLDLRRYGSVPHSGFGMGLERVVAWICGLDHLREAIPFPRMLTRLEP